jgi:hypothetical protein
MIDNYVESLQEPGLVESYPLLEPVGEWLDGAVAAAREAGEPPSQILIRMMEIVEGTAGYLGVLGQEYAQLLATGKLAWK